MTIRFSTGALIVAGLASPIAASAQPYPPPPPPGAYAPGPAAPPSSYGPPPGYYEAPPPGYDGSQPPPPPPGYDPREDAAEQRVQDQRYAYEAQRWASENCVKSQANTGAGAVIGGLFGAIVGSSLAGRHDHGGAALAGAAIGAVGGAAIASSAADATSPGCPPGFVVRASATRFYVAEPYVYAAPVWYRPWVWYGGRWEYRPYPYRVWYSRHLPRRY